MYQEGDKVRYKTGKGGQGQGIGTIIWVEGKETDPDWKRLVIRTANGKHIRRKPEAIIGPAEEETPAPEPAPESQLTAF